MMKIFRQWFASLHEVERDLWNQGYIVVYGGGTSFVVPVVSSNRPARRPGKRSLLLDYCSGGSSAYAKLQACVRVQQIA
jgi:hypothetical protein